MSSISSWTLRRSFDCSAVAFAICASWTSTAFAEAGSVRLGLHFYDTPEHRYQDLHTLTEVLASLKSDMQQFVTGFDGCPSIVTGPIDKGTPRDTLRDTWTAVQSIRVECWFALQFDPETSVAATGPTDRITPDMIHGIMAYAERLSVEDEEWAKALTTLAGGRITCKDRERCQLSAPDGSDWAGDSVLFDLALVHGDERFVEVTQQHRGRAGFVYGVRWRDRAGRVVEIFPQLR